MRRLWPDASPIRNRLAAARGSLDAWVLPVGGWLQQPGNFLAFVAVLTAALFAITALGLPGAAERDAEALLFSQSFQLGYGKSEPPLYAWLLLVVAEVWAPSPAAAAALKFSLLFGLYVAYWRLGHWTLLDPRSAAAAALAPFAIFPLGWLAVTGLSQAVLASLLYVLAALFLVRLDYTGRTREYVLLGVVVGLGLLAQYAFAVFAVALIGAALLDPLFRERLADRRSWIAAALAAAIAAPHYAWLAASWLASGPQAVAADTTPYWEQVADAFLQAVRGGAGFLLPLLVLLPLLLPEGFQAMPKASPDLAPEARARHLLGRQLLLLIAIVAVGVLALPPERLGAEQFFFFLLAPLWWCARARAAGAVEAAFRRVAVLGAVAGLLAVAALAGKAGLGALWCGESCGRHIAYGTLAERLRDAGFRGGTVVADTLPDPIAGNLRAALPEARVVSAAHPRFVPPPGTVAGDCLLVWPLESGPLGERAVRETARSRLQAAPPEGQPAATVVAPLAGLGGGDYALAYHLIRGGAGNCR